MKFFIDTQFHEYYKSILFSNNMLNVLDPISIGIVSEDVVKSYILFYDGNKTDDIKGIWDSCISSDFEELKTKAICRNVLIPEDKKFGKWVIKENKYSYEYYAICKDFDLSEAWSNKKLRLDILIPLTEELARKELSAKKEEVIDSEGLMSSRFTIWIGQPMFKDFRRLILKYGKTKQQIAAEIKEFCNASNEQNNMTGNISFYGYYSSHDWVVFTQLYNGLDRMPKEFPTYCNDLKQTLSEKYSPFREIDHNLEDHPDFAKNETSAISLNSARWNKQLYEFLN